MSCCRAHNTRLDIQELIDFLYYGTEEKMENLAESEKWDLYKIFRCQLPLLIEIEKRISNQLDEIRKRD